MAGKVKSLDKALRILDCFSQNEPELGITELSRRFSLYKSNVHNIVSTFEENGFLEKDKATGKYRLGLKIMRLAHVVSSTRGVHSVVSRCVSELSAALDEIVYFGIPYNEQVMYMEGAFPEKIYNLRWVAGMTAPLTCTGIGKAILAFADERTIDAVLERPLERFTDHTITDKDVLCAELLRIRERGFSVDNMEHEFGVKCVGVPVFNRNDELLGALSTTGPSLRFSDDRLEVLVERLKETSTRIRNSL